MRTHLLQNKLAFSGHHCLRESGHQYLTILFVKTCNKRTLQELFTSKSSIQTPVTLFSDVVLKLSTLFQIDALTDWTLCYEQSLLLCQVTLCYKRFNNLLLLQSI